MVRVLVVDDEPQILRAMRINLRVRGYEVDTAATGKQALEMAARHPPDLVILDLGLPDLDGVEIIGGLRGWSTAPIIVLSGRAESTDKVEALDAGADDYVTKPFGMDELLARMRAAVRRVGAGDDEPQVRLGDLMVDLAAKRVTRPDGTEIRLTPTEWHLLEYLLREGPAIDASYGTPRTEDIARKDELSIFRRNIVFVQESGKSNARVGTGGINLDSLGTLCSGGIERLKNRAGSIGVPLVKATIEVIHCECQQITGDGW